MPATRKRTTKPSTTTSTSLSSEPPCLLGFKIPDGLGGTFQLTKLLGKGSFAVVYLAAHSSSSTSFAVKVLFKHNLTHRQLSLLRQEAALMKSLSDHPNILKLHGTIETDDDYIFLVTEYCEMDFYEALINFYPAGFPEDVVKEIFEQLVDALIYAHSRGIYHRDLKPENILISKNYDVKLADWGLATTDSW
jgi:serine/threonine protein kinase